ncbi:MAG: spore coat protein CotJB [Clostridia bacterium]|nr:spore coat protein CotJB [Clostridia bacterium]
MNRRCMTPRMRALYEIQTHAFAATETQLFLDTHGDVRAASQELQRQRGLEREAARRYEAQFGPLSAVSAVQNGDYRWAETPWPWEREA